MGGRLWGAWSSHAKSSDAKARAAIEADAGADEEEDAAVVVVVVVVVVVGSNDRTVNRLVELRTRRAAAAAASAQDGSAFASDGFRERRSTVTKGGVSTDESSDSNDSNDGGAEVEVMVAFLFFCCL